MAIYPTFSGPNQASESRVSFSSRALSAMSMKWAAVHDAASAVGELAGVAPEFRKPDVRNFPAIMRDTGGWRHNLAQQGVDDLAAIMEPGLAALMALQTRGAPVAAAATALWQEFQSTRAALLALVPPLGVERAG